MQKAKKILIIGGARSGKSRQALLLSKPYRRKTLIATLEPKDEEMKARISRHKRARGRDWRVIEEPLDLAGALKRAARNSDCVVIDCLTLWLTNLMLAGARDKGIEAELAKVCRVMSSSRATVLVVSNEVGMGIVPADPLTRRFRDLQGRANQVMAVKADEVFLMSAGIALKIKGAG